jgi:hypothetical protein
VRGVSVCVWCEKRGPWEGGEGGRGWGWGLKGGRGWDLGVGVGESGVAHLVLLVPLTRLQVLLFLRVRDLLILLGLYLGCRV